MALAGPAVNVVIAVAIFAWLFVTNTVGPVTGVDVTRGSFLERLMLVNVFLVGFNLIPAFPMDGGRVLRAVLATRMEYARATQIAAHVGQGMALLFGFVGLFSNPFLLFIAFFVWIGATQESSMVQMKSALSGIPVNRAMLTDYRTLASTDPVQHAVDLILAGSQHDFPVVDDGRVVGMLTRGDLFSALSAQGQDAAVGGVMQTNFRSVDAFDMLEPAMQQLQECACHTMPVVRAGRIVGLLTMDNVGEFVAIQAALGGSRTAGRQAQNPDGVLAPGLT